MRRFRLLLFLVPAAIGAALALWCFQGAARRAATPRDTAAARAPATAFDAAVADARAANLPLLVLIRPLHERCPPADRLRDLLIGSPELVRCCVPVEACGAPGTGAAEVRVVTRARRGRTIPPLLAVVTPDLEVLHVQAAHLMCFYVGGGARLSLEYDCGSLWGGIEIADLVSRTLARKADVERLLQAPLEAGRPEARLERAELLAEIGRTEETARMALQAVEAPLSMEQFRRVLALLLKADDEGLARRFAEDVLATRGEEPGAGWLLLDAQAVRAPASAEALEKAAERARLGGEWRLEFRLKAARLRALSPNLPDARFAAQIRALQEVPTHVFQDHPLDHARFLDDLARAAATSRDVEEAERLIRQLDREHPDTDEAVIYRHGQIDRLREGFELRVPPRRVERSPPSADAGEGAPG